LKTTATILFTLVLSSFVAGCGSNCPPPATSASSTCKLGKTFIVVRHAEKASSDKDTPLSEKGQSRANQLATLLANVNATRLIATQYKRTQQTLEPLATKLGKKVEVAQADKTKDLIADLKAAPDGAVIVVASHSNVVPQIVKELAPTTILRGVEKDTLPDDEFARVYVIVDGCGAQRTLELSSDPT
jgi:2,3-bisphosphoglycerate-dependent phosphoglycerate mutase